VGRRVRIELSHEYINSILTQLYWLLYSSDYRYTSSLYASLRMLSFDGLLSLLLPFLLLSVSTLAKDEPCTVRSGNKFYDLRSLVSSCVLNSFPYPTLSLTVSVSKDYHFRSPTGAEFSINVCRTLVNDTWHVAPPVPSEIAGTVRRAHGDFALGVVNSTIDVRAGAPVITYTGGSACPKDDKAQAATVVRFVCDRGFTSGGPMEGSGKGTLPGACARESMSLCLTMC
jgi:hypothetical protein